MLFTVVDCGLIALESGLVNPLQALLFIDGNACTGHQKPACGKLCLGITAIGCQLVPESTFLQVLLYAVTIPKGCTYILLAQNMALESSLTIPKESLMVIFFDTIAKVVGS